LAATAAQRLAERDLAGVDFLAGVANGRWSLAREVTEARWPAVFTYVTTAARPNSPDRLLVRWDLDGYSAQSPTGAFWNDAVDQWETLSDNFLPTNKWPRGRPETVVATVFKISGWAAPGKGFYHPYDRLARQGHDAWTQANPNFIWTPDRTMVDFLALVHRWLNCEDYLGC
jgi:hypothetical protein